MTFYLTFLTFFSKLWDINSHFWLFISQLSFHNSDFFRSCDFKSCNSDFSRNQVYISQFSIFFTQNWEIWSCELWNQNCEIQTCNCELWSPNCKIWTRYSERKKIWIVRLQVIKCCEIKTRSSFFLTILILFLRIEVIN